jgi:hypothetical protein
MAGTLKTGMLEQWNNGVLEEWNSGILGFDLRIDVFPIIP